MGFGVWMSCLELDEIGLGFLVILRVKGIKKFIN